MATVITPEYLARTGTEDGEQSALFCWANMAARWGFEFADDLSNYRPYKPDELEQVTRSTKPVPELKWLHAIPNGGERTPQGAARLKAMGVKKGVADTFLPVCRVVQFRTIVVEGVTITEARAIRYSGLYIEMKRRGGDERLLSDEQKDFRTFVTQQGYCWCVAFSWRQAADTITSYLRMGNV